MKLHNFLVMLFLLTGAVFFVACGGKDGKDGVDGKDGAKGEKGDTGERGPAGPPGPAGADGRAGTDAPYDARCDVSNGIKASGGIWKIYGTNDDDVICVDSNGNNEIRAGGGDDTVYGGGGNDKMLGGDGDDTMYGEGGQDHFYIGRQLGANKWIGGEGRDIMYFREERNTNTLGSHAYTLTSGDALSAAITFDLSSGTFDGSSLGRATGTFTIEGIEDVIGGSGGDTLTGDDQKNYIAGENGADTLNGGKGDDVLYGGGLDDSLDTLNGGEGDDILWDRGRGNDILTGGAGADIFLLQYRNPLALPVIKDFNVAEDKIYFTRFPAGDSARAITRDGAKLKVGNVAAVEIHDGANGASPSQATAILNKKADLIKFVTATFIGKTRTFTFTEQ